MVLAVDPVARARAPRVPLATVQARMVLRDAIGLYAEPLTSPAVLALDAEASRDAEARRGPTAGANLSVDEAAELLRSLEAAIERAAAAAEAAILSQLTRAAESDAGPPA